MNSLFVLDPQLAADTHVVGELEFSRLLLMNDARFPWLILVPRQAGLRDLIDLSREDQHILLDEINRCAHVLQALEKPHKLNIAALGNVVAQLHIHLIARFALDPAWPRPVWGCPGVVAYSENSLRVRLTALRSALRLDQEA